MFIRKSTLLVAAAAFAVGCGGGGESSKFASTTNGGSTGGSATQGTTHVVAAMATGRVGQSVTVIPGTGFNGGKVLIAGGLGKSGSTIIALDTAELYDPASGTISVLQSRLPSQIARQGAAADRLGNVVLAGGHSDAAGSTALSSLVKFNASTSQFQTVSGSLAGPKSEPIMVNYESLGADRVAIVGGKNGTQSVRTGDIYRADSGTMQSTSSAFGVGTARHAGDSIAMADGRVFIQGGLTPTVEIFDPATETFSAAGSLPTTRYAAGLARLGNFVAVIGGRQSETGVSTATDTIQLYDVTTQTFTATINRLPEPISGASTVQLANGDVIVIGGQNISGQVVNTTTIITGNGVDAGVVRGPSLAVARKDAEAVVLPNGSVLIVGGVDQNGTPIDTVELFATSQTQVPATPIPGISPTITLLTPNTGSVGTQVTVESTGFSQTPSSNVVTFGGIVAPVQAVVSNGVRVAVPTGLPDGQYNVTLRVSGQTSGPLAFTVTTGSTTGGTGTGTGGTGTSAFSGPPHILFALPSSGGAFMPIGIVGSNFENPTVPYVNGTPSISLFNFGIKNIPFIGSFTIGSTLVPVASPSGPGALEVEHYGLRSNLYPFTVN